MKQSKTVGNLMVALAKSQSEFQKFEKNRKAYQYDYLTLDGILDHVRPILGENGIAFIQEQRINVRGDTPFVLIVTRLFHGDQWIEHSIDFPLGEPTKSMTEIQVFGAYGSYLKRYAVMAILGVTGSEKEEVEDMSDGANRPNPNEVKLK